MAQLRSIEPGKSTLADVLARLGPPDFIIDGTQRLVEPESLAVGYSADRLSMVTSVSPTPYRSITAQEGTVILIYQYVEVETGGMVGAAPYAVGVIGRFGKRIRHDEVFLYVSKQDLRVVRKIVPPTAENPS